ncbi:MAG: hypothetical protein NTU60_09370 [Candidatus Aminicenantes bacterium]|nr:hypothetical protein [Candidatus Aminicenantes bacterium]
MRKMLKTMRSLLASLALLTLSALCASAQENQRDRFEVGLYLGYGRSRAEGRSTYHHEWSTLRFSRVVENDLLSLDPDPALSGGGFLSFYPVRFLGVQAGFGYLKTSMAGSSVFDLSPPSGSVPARSDRWDGHGELTAVPLCLNLVGRTGPAQIQAFASGGMAVFLNSFFAGSSAGLGGAAAAGGGEEKLDAFKVPVTVEDQTWTAIGANFGGGFDLRIGKRLALSAEVRYFLCPARDFGWTWTPGVYEGLGKNIPALNLSRETAQLAGRRTTFMTIRPSFLHFSAGIKFFLPGIVKVSAGSSKRRPL